MLLEVLCGMCRGQCHTGCRWRCCGVCVLGVRVRRCKTGLSHRVSLEGCHTGCRCRCCVVCVGVRVRRCKAGLSHRVWLEILFGERTEDLGSVIREEDRLLLRPASIWQLPELRAIVSPSSRL